MYHLIQLILNLQLIDYLLMLELHDLFLSNAFQVKHDLAQILKNELRRIPELLFFMDDSLDYIEGIDAALQSPENPIIERDKLVKRKKK